MSYLKTIFQHGIDELNLHIETINKLNVFPIPDNDTGSNMSKTLSNIDDIDNLIFNARGSSGNILSLFLMKFLKDDTENTDILRKNAIEGINNIYSYIDNIKDGTIIDIFKVISKAKGNTINEYFDCCIKDSLEEWKIGPDKLSILKENNTYDSGALGMIYILNGIEIYLNNISYTYEINEILNTTGKRKNNTEYKKYCIEFEITPPIEKYHLYSYGDEIICITSDNKTKVHIHTDEKEKLLDFANSVGNIYNLKIDIN